MGLLRSGFYTFGRPNSTEQIGLIFFHGFCDRYAFDHIQNTADPNTFVAHPVYNIVGIAGLYYRSVFSQPLPMSVFSRHPTMMQGDDFSGTQPKHHTTRRAWQGIGFVDEEIILKHQHANIPHDYFFIIAFGMLYDNAIFTIDDLA